MLEGPSWSKLPRESLGQARNGVLEGDKQGPGQRSEGLGNRRLAFASESTLRYLRRWIQGCRLEPLRCSGKCQDCRRAADVDEGPCAGSFRKSNL